MRDVLNEVIDALQAALPVNRVVILVSLLVIAPVAGTANAWLATQFPGVEFPTEAIAAAFLLGVGGTVAALYRWIDGWQADEQRQADALLEARESERFEAEAKLRAGKDDEKPVTEPVDDAEPPELPGT